MIIFRERECYNICVSILILKIEMDNLDDFPFLPGRNDSRDDPLAKNVGGVPIDP